MGNITTHVLDISAGRPAERVPVVLERQNRESVWEIVGQGQTDADGRSAKLLEPDTELRAGIYRITFNTETYFSRHQTEGFYPEVVIAFTVRNAAEHYHVPLLLSPYGYSTYRGS